MLKQHSDYIYDQLQLMDATPEVNGYFAVVAPLQIPVDKLAAGDVGIAYRLSEQPRPTKNTLNEYALSISIVSTSFDAGATGYDLVQQYIEGNHPRWRFQGSDAAYVNERAHCVIDLNYNIKL